MSNQSNQPARSGGMNLQTIIGILAGLYGASPIDAMPDFVPVIGYGDDAIVIVIAVLLIIAVTVADRGQGGAE